MYKILFALLFIAPLSAYASDVLNKMSVQERFYLRKFFKKVVCNDQWGYALFFDKPVSLAGFFLKCPSQEILHPYSNKLMKKGWKVWKKHAYSFPSSHFLLCEEIDSSAESILCKVYLINKPAFLKVVNENLTIFKNRLGENFSPEKLLSEIENTKTLTPHLEHDEGLLGIVLGFEVNSSLLFGARAPLTSQAPTRDQFLQRVESLQSAKCKIHPVTFLGDPQSP